MSNPLVITASSGAISSFINLDGKRGIKGESFTAPSANRLIKVFAVFVLYFLNLRPPRQQGHTDDYCLPFKEYSQSSCTECLLWWLIWRLKTYWLCSVNTLLTKLPAASPVRIKKNVHYSVHPNNSSQSEQWKDEHWMTGGLLTPLHLCLHKAESCAVREEQFYCCLNDTITSFRDVNRCFFFLFF